MLPDRTDISGALQPVDTKPDSLTDRVYDAIREALILQRLQPGTRVSEARLAEQLKVSKTPVREALLRLVHVGLIESDGRRGGRVPRPSAKALTAAYELREGLETQCARLAAAGRGDTDLREIGTAGETGLSHASQGDFPGFRACDRDFHRAVAQATHNLYLIRQTIDAYDLTWTLRLRDTSTTSEHAVRCSEQHVRIAALIAEQDVVAAGEAMREHIVAVRDVVLGHFAAADDRNAAS